MLGDLWFALRRHRWDQCRYFRHTYSPFSPWRKAIGAVEAAVREHAQRVGIAARVDRRRAYQVARMTVSNRHGEHLVDLVPDAYLEYSPPSAATFHAGRRQYPPAAERRAAFLRHPQTLAYLLTPPSLSRKGIGASPPGGLVVIEPGEQAVAPATVLERLQQKTGSGQRGALRSYAEVLVALHRGVEESEADERAAA